MQNFRIYDDDERNNKRLSVESLHSLYYLWFRIYLFCCLSLNCCFVGLSITVRLFTVVIVVAVCCRCICRYMYVCDYYSSAYTHAPLAWI